MYYTCPHDSTVLVYAGDGSNWLGQRWHIWRCPFCGYEWYESF